MLDVSAQKSITRFSLPTNEHEVKPLHKQIQMLHHLRCSLNVWKIPDLFSKLLNETNKEHKKPFVA